MIALYIVGSLVVLAVAVYLLEPFLEVDQVFPEARLLRENWKVIRGEARALLADVESIPQFHEVDRLQRFISARDNVAWRTFFFKGFNRWLPQNCARAPRTTELLRRLPLISTALFSIIDGGKHIPPHVGFFKSVLRDQTLPPLFRWLNRLMFRLLAGSRKLQQAARRAEAARDIRP